MRYRTPVTALVGLALSALGVTSCRNDINVTDPNAPSSSNFWQTARDANGGVIATYNALLRLGTFQRWQAFTYDARSDIGTTAASPWAELAGLSKFQFPSGYGGCGCEEFVDHSFGDAYTLINRANLVLANVPGIDMDAGQKATYLGEAKFLRGLGYFHLMTLFGPNSPLITAPPNATDRPASSDSATMWAQIEKDFTEAAAALPKQLMSQSGGRATAGAAQGMLGKTLLQERKWAQASAALAPIVSGQYGGYQLVPSYATLFRQEGNNSAESLFEVQVGNVDLCGQGLCGLNIAKMSGACGPGYCDGRPTRWYLSQFFLDSTTTGQVDPRLDATIFYYKGDTTRIYSRTWAQWRTADAGNYTDTTRIYWKKYGEYYTGSNDQTWEAQINFKVLRYADVLLMQAEALNEQGQPAAALPLVNQVRQRVSLKPLAAGLSQAQMRAAILKERLLEFGLESQRWLDLGRQNLFADLATLRSHDTDFNTFVLGKSELMPIPQPERNLNPNVKQNPGW